MSPRRRLRSVSRVALPLAFCVLLVFARSSLAGEIPADDLQYMTFTQLDARTQAVVDKVIAAMGGDAALMRLQSLQKTSVVTQRSAQGNVRIDFDGVAVFPASLYATITTPTRKLTAVSTPESTHVFKSDAPIEGAALKMNDNEKRTFLQFFYEQPILVLRNRAQTGFLVAWGGNTVVNNRQLDVLAILVDEYEIRWYIDPSTGRVVRTGYGTGTTELDDWRQVGGLTLPFREHRFRDGKEVADTHVSAYVPNPAIDASKLFAKPRFWMSRNALPGRDANNAYWNGYSYESGSDYYDDYVYFVIMFY